MDCTPTMRERREPDVEGRRVMAPASVMESRRELFGPKAQRMLLVLAVFASFYLLFLRRMEPIQVFASEQERAEFMRTLGEPEDVEIIALVTDWCPACRSFESLLDESKVRYARVNIEQSAPGRALYEKAVGLGAPRSIPQAIRGLKLVDRREIFGPGAHP